MKDARSCIILGMKDDDTESIIKAWTGQNDDGRFR